MNTDRLLQFAAAIGHHMPSNRVKKPRCVLCTVQLAPTENADIWLHTESEDCNVRVADANGVSADATYFIADDGQVYLTDEAAAAQEAAEMEAAAELAAAPPATLYIIGAGGDTGPPAESAWTSSKKAGEALFESVGLPVLGGSSGEHGWSSMSMYQRCPHLWNVNYGARGRRKRRGPDKPGGESLEVGDIVHVLLAIHYSRVIDPAFPLEPIMAVEFLRSQFVTPAHLDESVRCFTAYINHWNDEFEYATPLAVEHLVVDPKTGRSCRWDLVLRLDRPYEGLLPGVYLTNHKTSGRDGFAAREQWRNDGQIIGEWDLYHALHFDRKWGAARGICINRVIRTKDVKCDRLWVVPPKEVVKDHQQSLTYWAAQMQVAKSANYFPRARAACVTRYGGLCDEFYNCAGLDPSEVPTE